VSDTPESEGEAPPEEDPEGSPEWSPENPDEGADEGGSDDLPDITEEETADASGLDPEALDPNTGDDEDDGEEDSDDGDDTADEGDGDVLDMDGSHGEWGDMYVSLCTQTTNAVIDKHGDGHEVTEAHFRQVDLDKHFNACMEKYTGRSDAPPEQALLVGTMLAIGGPVALHTDIPSRLSEEVQGDA
jgi:hypothetical protein